ncbi:hypothetical protein BDV23DRAFT_149336 [Aspergillus alliaceus]|uniref:Uncharacterized protein n=1 Tax=Petromyces alliaceus TaxID=209559 RepID=A0A5N7CH78_PETAA|nr:hypothetical protein BDV23DRAFT_149336 [Aspergillus alliaceus]
MSEQSHQPDQSTNTSSQRRRSSLPENLQKLLDKEEQYWDSYGDFENSWTTTRRNNDPPMVVGDMAGKQAQEGRVGHEKLEKVKGD